MKASNSQTLFPCHAYHVPNSSKILGDVPLGVLDKSRIEFIRVSRRYLLYSSFLPFEGRLLLPLYINFERDFIKRIFLLSTFGNKIVPCPLPRPLHGEDHKKEQ